MKNASHKTKRSSFLLKKPFYGTPDPFDERLITILPENEPLLFLEKTCDKSFVKVRFRAGEGFILSENITKGEGKKMQPPKDICASKLLSAAIEHIGTPYIWGGTDLKTGCDCSGFIYSLFAEFGMAFPRESSAQRHMCLNRHPMGWLSDTKKRNIIRFLPQCSLLFFPGHISMLLGEYKGEIYTVSAVNSYIPKRDEHLFIRAAVDIVPVSALRADGSSWLHNIDLAFF
ncbi:MAG: C40 family peptidase [Firmicutes bacterium]|nr:C40 family peptidase [Bacillota bacterium]